MILEKKLNIREVKKILRDLNDDLEAELTNKAINYQKTQPKSPMLKDIVVDQSHSSFDKFSHYVIKDEELDPRIIALQESIHSYEGLILKRIRSVWLANKDEARVIILREDEKWASDHKGEPMPWNLIGERTGYSERQCRRIYDKYLNS